MSGDHGQPITESAAPPLTNRPPRRTSARRIRRIAVAAGFITVAVATALVLIALALAQEQPRWWARIDAADPATISTAEAVENGVTSALTQVRPGLASGGPDKPWTVYITTDQANAWLNVRLKRWLADQTEQGAIDFKWPRELREVQISFAPGIIRLGATVMRPGGSPTSGASVAPDRPQTLAAALRPSFGQDGSLWLTAERVEIGRLPLPASWVIGRAGRSKVATTDSATDLANMPQAQRVLAAFKGERPVATRPIIKLADGRRVRLLAIEPAEGKLLLTCTTEQRGAQTPAP